MLIPCMRGMTELFSISKSKQQYIYDVKQADTAFWFFVSEDMVNAGPTSALG